MNKILYFFILMLFGSTLISQTLKIDLNQIEKDTTKGSFLTSSFSDSTLIFNSDVKLIKSNGGYYILMYGDTILTSAINPVTTSSIFGGTNITITDENNNITINADSIWGQSGSNIFYNDGNVGIGITSPSAKLDVVGDVEISDTLTLTTYDEGILSVDNIGKVMTTNLIQILKNASLGEGYAYVAREYHDSDGKTIYPSELGYNYAELLQADVLSKTSLILTPTAIATGIVASQKPLSSDGDFTFTRSTSATRVNENGYIEKETQNLLQYSNGFDNKTYWPNSNASVVSGQAGHDGTNNAFKIVENTTNNQHIIYQQNVFSVGVVQCVSVYAKAAERDWLMINQSGVRRTYYDLANGVMGSKDGGVIDATITDVGGGWYRCTYTADMDYTELRIGPTTGNGVNTYIGDSASGIFVQDAQLEQGLVARDYIETTTSAVYGGVTDNVPRIDYTDKTPSLLLEPQRTNLSIQSEYITGSVAPLSIQGAGMTISYNETTSPEGVDNAMKWTEASNNGLHWGGLNLAGTSVGDDLTISIFAKRGTSDDRDIIINIYDGATSDRAKYNLDAGTIVTDGAASNQPVVSMEDYGNGWWRCIYTRNLANSGYNAVVGLVNGTAPSWQGNGTSNIYTYGLQYEEGSYATSYIPTYGTAVTRLEDFSTADITSALSSNQGTLFIHLDDDADSGGYSSGALSIGLLDTAETVWVGWASNSPASTELRGIYRVGGSTTFVGASTPINTECKLLIKWGGGTVSFFKNGSLYNTQSVTDFSGQPLEQYQLPKQIRAGNYPIKQTLIFPTALTDSECIALTKIN